MRTFGAIGGTTRLLLTTNAGATWVVQNLTFFPFTQVSGIAAIDSATVVGIVNNNEGILRQPIAGRTGQNRWEFLIRIL